MMTTERCQLAGRSEIVQLVNTFYDRVQRDPLLGPIFNDVAHVDWNAHLPLMYDFWDSVLFSAGTFHGNPLVVHRALARMAPLGAREFDRWLTLFQGTIDDLFEGPMAEHARQAAARIAATLRWHMSVPPEEAACGDR